MAYVQVTITDTLAFWDDYLSDYVFNPAQAKTFTNWYRLPAEWLDGAALKPDRREALLQHMYGADWRAGNGDGSRYTVLDLQEHLLSDAEAAERPWSAARKLVYVVGPDGAITQAAEGEG